MITEEKNCLLITKDHSLLEVNKDGKSINIILEDFDSLNEVDITINEKEAKALVKYLIKLLRK